jgi:hypothetical protein
MHAPVNPFSPPVRVVLRRVLCFRLCSGLAALLAPDEWDTGYLAGVDELVERGVPLERELLDLARRPLRMYGPAGSDRLRELNSPDRVQEQRRQPPTNPTRLRIGQPDALGAMTGRWPRQAESTKDEIRSTVA